MLHLRSKECIERLQQKELNLSEIYYILLARSTVELHSKALMSNKNITQVVY